jgi:hypothetical protein
MFDDARNVGWHEAIVRIADIMSTRISHCCIKHADRQASEVVTRVSQIMKHQWDASASISVIEIETDVVTSRLSSQCLVERSL